MDEEDSSQGLLAPTPELLASVKVFPLIPRLKKDVLVCYTSDMFKLAFFENITSQTLTENHR